MPNPGWYPDPKNTLKLRWWDGAKWTDDVAPAQTAEGLAAYIAELRKELESVEQAVTIQSFGFYRPRYGFESAEEYTWRLEVIREHQKELIKDGLATECRETWTVDGSQAQGRKMVERMAKLMLRAFNGECDAAIGSVRYDNILKLETRISKSCNDINKMGTSMALYISKIYHDAKIEELRLVHEHREKKQEEKEEQRRQREEMREEQRANEEFEKALEKAEKAEDKARAALEKAQSQLFGASEAQQAKLEALIVRLETELKSALDTKAKAISRAQLTKSGHVYVLSNHGSFGEGVYKIGLTRRLDPYDRVDELGDASVPFPFDVHAIVFAPDAPALEHKLHLEFADRRVNMMNRRKEYFRATLDEIRAAFEKHHGLVSFVLTPEAEEWRKTLAMLDMGEVESGDILEA